MKKVRVGLIGAMEMEVEPYLEWMSAIREERVGPHRFWLGEAFGLSIVVGCCGIGKVNAAMGAQAMLQRYAPEFMLHTGVCGSLTAELAIGDVLVAKDCVQYDVDTTATGDPIGMVSTLNRVSFPCDPRASTAILKAAEQMNVHACAGRASTGDRFLTHMNEKRWIVDTFGALTCDQESCAIAQVCLVHDTPCAIIRAVSDASDDAHEDEYESWAPRAAIIAASLAWKFLEKTGAQFE